jgi:drug/metabolite transporter (DMT)-like permease
MPTKTRDRKIVEAPGFPSAVIFLAAAIWGLYWLPLRFVENAGMTGVWSVFAINSVPLVVLVPLAIWRRRIILADPVPVIVIGMMTGFGLACYSIGLVYSSVIRVTLLFYLTPVWSTILAYFILGERAGWKRLGAILLGFGGLYLMLSAEGSNVNPLNYGDLAGLLSGIFWGLGAVALRRWPHTKPADNVPSQFLFGSLLAILVIAATSGIMETAPAWPVWRNALPVVIPFHVLIIVPSLFAIFWASQKVSPGRAGILMMSEVLVAGISAPLFAGEALSGQEAVGAVLIVSAGLVEVLGQEKSD